MAMRLPQPKIPSPSEIVQPFQRLEDDVISLVQAPFQGFGLPVPPKIVGPIAIVGQIASQIPAPPQPPGLPNLPNLPKLPGS